MDIEVHGHPFFRAFVVDEILRSQPSEVLSSPRRYSSNKSRRANRIEVGFCASFIGAIELVRDVVFFDVMDGAYLFVIVLGFVSGACMNRSLVLHSACGIRSRKIGGCSDG